MGLQSDLSVISGQSHIGLLPPLGRNKAKFVILERA